MELANKIFNKSSVYEMLYLNIKGVLEYSSLEHLEAENKEMFNRWEYISKKKYSKFSNTEKAYQEKAVLYPEFTKIVAITYAVAYPENGELKRQFKKIVSNNEKIVLATFIDELNALSSDAAHSTPQVFPSICGHNIINYDIPFLMKRYIKHNLNDIENKEIPLIIKKILGAKPWESNVVDTTLVWKFNGYGVGSLMLIADFLGLKKKTDLLTHTEMSQYYWNNIGTDEKKTLDYIGLQSATQTNLIIQLINHLRHF